MCACGFARVSGRVCAPVCVRVYASPHVFGCKHALSCVRAYERLCVFVCVHPYVYPWCGLLQCVRARACMRVCVRARAQVSADGAIVTERSPSDDAALERLDSIRVLD